MLYLKHLRSLGEMLATDSLGCHSSNNFPLSIRKTHLILELLYLHSQMNPPMKISHKPTVLEISKERVVALKHNYKPKSKILLFVTN
jgi:hypothetical protein